MLLCLPGLLGSDQSAKPLRVVVVCMRIGVSVFVCVCVSVLVNESEGCQPCPEQPGSAPPERCGTKRPVSERASGRKSVSVLERVCVLFLNASLTAVAAYERGLVLVEQMAEC